MHMRDVLTWTLVALVAWLFIYHCVIPLLKALELIISIIIIIIMINI